MNNIILTTPTELESIVAKAVQMALSHFKPNSNSDFLSIEEAAEIVNLSKNTIYGMVSKREIPFYKRGKKLYFKSGELQEWIGSQKVQTVQEMKDELNASGGIGSIAKPSKK